MGMLKKSIWPRLSAPRFDGGGAILYNRPGGRGQGMVEKKALKELAAKVGKEKVFLDREYLLTYSYDATGLEYLPDAVVFAETEADVGRVVDWCRRHSVPLVPRGAGVGYT